MISEERTQGLPRTWDKYSGEQLRLCAIDLAGLYYKEKQLRLELEARNRELKQKAQELSALNAMFRNHLNLSFGAKEALTQFVNVSKQLAALADQLLQEIADQSVSSIGGDEAETH